MGSQQKLGLIDGRPGLPGACGGNEAPRVDVRQTLDKVRLVYRNPAHSVMPLAIHPLTPGRWPDLVDLFGPERGANSGCWCMWPRIPRSEWDALGKDGRKRRFAATVKKGPPPGLLAYEGGEAIGWVAVGPRASVSRFNLGRTSKPGGAWRTRSGRDLCDHLLLYPCRSPQAGSDAEARQGRCRTCAQAGRRSGRSLRH